MKTKTKLEEFKLRIGDEPRQYAMLLATLALAKLLHRWTIHGSIRTIHTTVTFLWFKNLMATATFIKVLAGVGGHRFLLLVATFRTGYGRQDYV
jgi:hypothetical protein